MNDDLKQNLLNLSAYKRLGVMVVFVLIFSIVELIIYAVALFQILFLLFTGSTHTELKKFAQAISAYLFDIVKFLTFDTEQMPFPFESWNYDQSGSPKKEEPKSETKKDDPDHHDEIHA